MVHRLVSGTTLYYGAGIQFGSNILWSESYNLHGEDKAAQRLVCTQAALGILVSFVIFKTFAAG